MLFHFLKLLLFRHGTHAFSFKLGQEKKKEKHTHIKKIISFKENKYYRFLKHTYAFKKFCGTCALFQEYICFYVLINAYLLHDIFIIFLIFASGFYECVHIRNKIIIRKRY